MTTGSLNNLQLLILSTGRQRNHTLCSSGKSFDGHLFELPQLCGET